MGLADANGVNESPVCAPEVADGHRAVLGRDELRMQAADTHGSRAGSDGPTGRRPTDDPALNVRSTALAFDMARPVSARVVRSSFTAKSY